ncbi:hypothetical protein D9M72_351050 [compost metagenome]
MRTSSNWIWQVSDACWPSFSSTRTTWNPGVSVGTMKALMPFLPACGSVTAKTITIPAWLPEVMNCLAPFST